jgi:Cu(I)/Ag(I) efflux system membrane protein CusA/SilA
VVESGKRRLKACLMTTATTILALLPVLTSKGSGADLMIPMAIPVFGGMLFEIITVVSVPVFCSLRYEFLLRFKKRKN